MVEIIFDENEDWEKRILCSDESCIGTIGFDGRCKECGRVYEGDIPGEQGVSRIQVEVDGEQLAVPEEMASDDEWENRVLCSDGCCIGVIGVDGKCKECGKPFSDK